jgi:hypothetical protein
VPSSISKEFLKLSRTLLVIIKVELMSSSLAVEIQSVVRVFHLTQPVVITGVASTGEHAVSAAAGVFARPVSSLFTDPDLTHGLPDHVAHVVKVVRF